MTNPCVIPTIRDDGDGEWKKQHKRYVDQAKKRDPAVILIGASIIELIQCYPIWVEEFEPLNSLNFGISGDRTQEVLWRIQNGLLDQLTPKVCILNIGTNNFDNTPTEVSEGILTIINEIRSKLPNCYIIVIGILPSGPSPSYPMRDFGTNINEIVGVKIKSMSKVELFNADLLQPDGTLSTIDAPDYLHPSESGYRKIFNPIFKRLVTILNS